MMLASEMDLMEFCLKHEKIALYGMGGMGKSLYSYLKMHGWAGKLAFFVVTHKQEDSFDGIRVKDVHLLENKDLAVPVLIATRRNCHEGIRRELAMVGAGNIYIMDEDLLTGIEQMAHLLEQEDQDEKMRFFAAQMRQMTEGINLLYGKMNQIQEMLGELKDEKK